MAQKVSIFNWSLTKLLATEPDLFSRAKLRILFTILLFSIAKLLITAVTAYTQGQGFQLGRSAVMLTISILVLKILLSNKQYMKLLAHIMIWTGILLVWSSVFVAIQGINIATMQFVFMIVLTSFYLLNKKFGIIYAIISITPIIIHIISGDTILPLDIAPAELASPGYQIIVVLNFMTMIISHYLYHQAFGSTIIEKENLNLRLKAAVNEANQAAQSKSDFLSTMSHELRTPLNSVIGMSELLLDDPHNKEQAENLQILNFSAVSLHSLINDILDFNKMDSDKLHLEAISVNLHSLIHNICAGLRFQAKEKGLNLLVDIDESLKNTYLITDPTRITQIIYNLGGNAIKFTSEGQVSVNLNVLSNNGEFIKVKFSVIDSGIGINTDMQEEIFEPFVQASTSTTREYGGTGLGLAIVKRLLALFGTEIHLESSSGRGSNFFFEISFKLDKQPADTHDSNAELIYDLSSLRVLIAEDNPLNRLLLKKVFAKWNNEPVFAENGQETLEKLNSSRYDVILMDIHMPIMDGYETSRAIRNLKQKERAEVRIIALTASVSGNLAEKIKQAGMNDYICKPFNSKELYSKLIQEC